MSFASLRVRLLVAAAISIILALALAAAGLAWLFERHVERWIDSGLEVELNQLVGGLRRSPTGQIEIGKMPSDPRFEQPLSGLYWQVAIEPSGPVLRSRSLWDFQLALPDAKVDDALHQSRLPGPGGSTLYVLQRHVELPETLGGGTAKAAVALNAGELRAAVWRFTGALTPFLILVGALLVAAAWIQVSIGLRPLSAMRNTLIAIRTGERRRLGSGYPDEVQPLAREIDSLLDARDAQLEKARARAADLAHGLKTPLQVLSGEAERLRTRGAVDIAGDIESIAEDMQRHIERHLTRTRLAPPSEDVSTNLRDIAERVARVVERTPAGARLTWSNTVPADLTARIDPDDLAEALGNLIENATRHARSKVMISGASERDMAALTIFMTGRAFLNRAARRHCVAELGSMRQALAAASVLPSLPTSLILAVPPSRSTNRIKALASRFAYRGAARGRRVERSKPGFEDAEALLQLPLLRRLLAPFEKRFTGGGGLLGAGVALAGTRQATVVGRRPQARARQEAVFEPVAHQMLQIGIAEVVGLDRAHIFMGEVDARDALVIGRERYRHAESAIERKGVVLALDAKDHVVAGEVDLDHHALCRHVLHQLVGAVFVHHVDAMTDAIGLRHIHGEPDVAA